MSARGADAPESVRTDIPDYDAARAVVRVPVSPGILAELLGIPDDHEIVGCRWDMERAGGVLELLIEGSDLPVIEPGTVIPRVVPTIHVDTIAGRAVRRWDWNLDSMEDPS